MRINSFVTPETLSADELTLSPEESHHLARVLRVESGQELTLFDGKGIRAEATIAAVTKKAVTVRVTGRTAVPPPPVDITLFQAVCKPDRFEMILQKATELGVRTIQPVNSQNTALPAVKMKKLAERGEAIIRNAAQQCGTAWLPQIRPLCTFSEMLPALKPIDAAVIGSLHAGAAPFRKTMQSLNPVRSAALLIGPEGDFTEKEVESAVEAGAQPVTFGDRILRTETAALFGLSVLVYELF